MLHTMKTPASLRIRTLIALIAIIPFHFSLIAGNDNALRIDGILRTPGNSLDGAQVSVLRDARPVTVLTEGLGRFSMRLDLQHTYLLTFEREGCITKQLYFDTRVPAAELVNAPFTFPFKVTLEDRSPESNARYVGPVGFVRYDRALKDFDYDKNYDMLQDLIVDPTTYAIVPAAPVPPLKLAIMTQRPRLDERISTVEAITPEKILASTMIDRTIAEPIMIASIPGAQTIIRLRRMAQPFIDATLAEDEANSGMAFTAMHANLRGRNTVRIAVAKPKRAWHDEAHRKGTSFFTSAPALPDGRTEDLIVDRLRVTTIIHITTNGHTKEYRRVSHRYGQVFFFADGLPCSSQAFEDVRAEK